MSRNMKLTNSNDILADSVSIVQADGTILNLAEAVLTSQSVLSSDYYTKSQTDSQITNAVNGLVDTAPATLDTLNELAAALGDDPNFATTITNQLGSKLTISDYQTTETSILNYVGAQDALKLNTADFNSTIANYDTSATVNSKLTSKADTTYVDSQDALKLNITDFNSTIANYDTTATVNSKLTSKADTTYVDSQDALKLNITDFNSTIANYDTSTTVNSKLTSKADQATTYTKTETDTLLNGKEDTITGAISNVLQSNLTPSSLVVTLPTGKLATVNVSDTEAFYLDGVTSNIQTQLNSKASTSYVDTQDALKLNTTDFNTTIANYDTSVTVSSKISALVDSAPATLDTLNELAQALGDDPNFATTVSNQIGLKADQATTYTKTETDTLLNGKEDTITLTPSSAVVTLVDGSLGTVNVSDTEVFYLDGVTSNIQTQLNSKASSGGYGVSKALITDATGNIIVAPNVSSTELDQLRDISTAQTVQAQINGKQNTISLTPSSAVVTLVDGSLGTVNVSDTEVFYLDGCTSNIQSQLNGKQATITGAGSTVVSSDLAVDRVLKSNASGKIGVSTITSTELAHLDGVTSNIQTQLNAKQNSNLGTANRALISDASGNITVAANVSNVELDHLKSVTSNVQTQLDGKLAKSGFTADRVIVSDATGNAVASSNMLGVYLGAGFINKCVTADNGGNMTYSTATSQELDRLSGVTSNVQTQIDAKQNSNLGTANRALISDPSGNITVAANVSNVELDRLNGVTSHVQTQIDDIRGTEFEVNYQVQETKIISKNPNTSAQTLQWASVYCESHGVTGQFFAGGESGGVNGAVKLTSNTAHIIELHADRTVSLTAGLRVYTDNDVSSLTAITTHSDRRLKEKIKDVNLNACLKMVKNINPKTYVRKDIQNKNEMIGFIAQDIEEHLPKEFQNLVKDKTDSNNVTLKTVDYASMNCVLWKVVQDLMTRIEKLENRI